MNVSKNLVLEIAIYYSIGDIRNYDLCTLKKNTYPIKNYAYLYVLMH